MQKYCTVWVKWSILKFCRTSIKSFVQPVLTFSQISPLTTVSKSHVPFGEILAFTQLCKCYYYSCFLERNWNTSISGAELERGSCKATNGSYYSTLATFDIINWTGVEAWHPSLHPHFPTGNSTPVKWGRVINLISTATACGPIENKLLVYWMRSNFMGIQEWLTDFVFVLPILLQISAL